MKTKNELRRARRRSLFLPAVVLVSAVSCEGSDDWVRQRPEFEEIAARLMEGDNIYLGVGPLETQRARVADPLLSEADHLDAMIQLAWQNLRMGHLDQALALIEETKPLIAGLEAPEAKQATLLRLEGIVYLRQAEVQNCIVRHNGDCCIFPLAGGGRHTVAEPARRAREIYDRYLEKRPDDLRVVWLLNLVAMAVGDYPEGVPASYLIPPETFASEVEMGRFVDVAPAAGVDTFNQCGGAIVDDFDSDGLLDVVTSTFAPDGPLHFYRNQGDGRFEDRSTASRLDDQLGGLNAIAADYDDDGDPDILVLRGAWLFDDGQIRNSLLRNNGDGTFTDVTRAAGLAEPAHPTQAAAWGDFDNDGDLDLYVVNEQSRDRSKVRHPAQMFRNNGDGGFVDVAPQAGLTNERYAKGVSAGDFDNDGDLDIYVSNISENRLYRNDGGMRFTDVAPALAVDRPRRRSFAPWFFDYNNDGWLDIFVSAYDADVSDIAADLLGVEHDATAPCLYRNNGDGTFVEVAESMGLNHPYLPMGANFGDLDNDGWLDLYLTTGDPKYESLMPNVVLRNDRGRRFQNATTSTGLGHLQKGHGVAFADLDNDGDQDIYHQLGGFYPGDAFHNALFVNPGSGNHYLTLHLEGKQTNRQGVGVRLAVTVNTPAGSRTIHRAVGSVSSFGGSPRRQHIGLGDAISVRRLEVYWPVSALRQSFDDLPLDSRIRIVEGSDSLERLSPPRYNQRKIPPG